MQDNLNTGDPDSRKYVSLACKNCRDKHRRCDGKIPCTRCFNLKLECQYVHAKTRGGFKKKGDTKKDILPVTGNFTKSLKQKFDNFFFN
jgi:hypothetical protein